MFFKFKVSLKLTLSIVKDNLWLNVTITLMEEMGGVQLAMKPLKKVNNTG